MIAWAFFDRMRNRKMSAVGACIGAVVGLVAITPAAGFVSLGESIFIGGISAVISNLAVDFKNSTSLDDTLDVFPCHGLGGIVGMILTAIFAGASEGGLLATGGNFGLIGAHLGALLITGIFSFFGSLLLFKIVDALLHIRVTESQEFKGLDLSQHGESILEPEQAQEILESALNFEESNA